MSNVVTYTPLRVIYKKVDEMPEVKVIKNEMLLYKAIIEDDVVIISYETVYIIYCNPKKYKNLKPNIVFNISNIVGDFIVINFDKKERKFKSLSQDDLVWYLIDMKNKSVKNIELEKPNVCKINLLKQFSRNDDENKFEQRLIGVLSNIELVLLGLLKKNGENKK